MRALFTCLPGHGHFNPMLPLALATAGAGHEVAFATAGDFCPRVVKAGFTAFPTGLSLDAQLAQARARYPEQAALAGGERFEQFVPRMLAGVAAPARAGDLLAAARDWRPDLLVHDEADFSAAVVAEVLGVPWADHSVGILRPLTMARLASEVLEPLCSQHGVDLGEFGGLFRWLYLDVAPPSLQSGEIGQVAVAHQAQNATLDAGAEGESLPGWVERLSGAPVVYVSLGTVFNERAGAVFATILEGLREEPVEVIVTIGHGNDPAVFGVQPDHIHVEQFIPQSLLLAFCDVVVNQGGTAILPILAHGLPLLLLPQGANQFHNAEACVTAGVGRRLLPGDVTGETVRREVRRLLDEPGFRERATAVQAELLAMPGPDRGRELLEALVATGRPIPGPGQEPAHA